MVCHEGKQVLLVTVGKMTESLAMQLKADLEVRFGEGGLEFHPEKTKIVYCKDEDRKGEYPRLSEVKND